MRRQEIIAALTEEEKQNLARNSFRLLCDLQVFDDTKALVTQLKRLLVQLYKNVPDACFHKTADGCYSASNIDYIDYYVAYKQIADLYYFADGRLTTGGFKNVEMPPWEPSNKTRQELEQKNNQCREEYNKRQSGQALEEEAKADIKKKDKDFWNGLLKHRYLCLKYQLCKVLKKKFTVPKRFNVNKQPLWQLAAALKDSNLSILQRQQVDEVIEDLHKKTLAPLFQSSPYSYCLSLIVFPSLADLNDAYTQRSLTYDTRDDKGWLQTNRFWKEEFIENKEDPAIKEKSVPFSVSCFINAVYTLQHYAKTAADEDVKEFLQAIGIVQPAPEEKEDCLP